jgi:hypothetical protein
VGARTLDRDAAREIAPDSRVSPSFHPHTGGMTSSDHARRVLVVDDERNIVVLIATALPPIKTERAL